MATDALTILARPALTGARMVLGLSGWMNGGDVSTGTIEHLVSILKAAPLARIAPDRFYLYNFPGPMEVSALFRPHTVVEDGLVKSYEPPTNEFHCDAANRLILFQGKEPHLDWTGYGECLLAVAAAFDVRTIWFVGSYAGVVPHTRDPRIYSSVSDAAMKPALEAHGIRFSNYQGPAGISTYLTRLAAERGVRLATLVAEIPAYVHGTNPRCIEAVTRRLSAILGLQVDLGALRTLSDRFEARVNEAVRSRGELGEMVHKMEAEYDSELFETQMGDLKEWLEQQGIRLD